MSGTSADGIDAVVAKITGSGRSLSAKLVVHRHEGFAPAFRRRVLEACLHGSVSEICKLNFVLGERFAHAALTVIRKAGLKQRDIAAIGSHGQTVHHLPNAMPPSTLQIGEPCVIAERTGITTVADFRVRDMAAGGQGAPLVPYADWALFTHPTRPRIIQNLGGIGNLTFLPPRASLDNVIAFDTGPANMVIDSVVNILSRGKINYDRNGRWAARGRVSEKLLTQCLAHPYLRRKPPKTTGREEFGEIFLRAFLKTGRKLRLSESDLVATATAFTAESVAEAYRRFVLPKIESAALPKLQIILGGGGAKNQTLARMLFERIRVVELCVHEDFGLDSSAKEPLAFAILAHETLLGRPTNVPSVTGARQAVILGKIVPGGG